MAARRSDDPIMLVARQLVETLAADPAFQTEVAEAEIQRRIDAGLLIPAERLQVAPGLTLVPVGRVETLEATLEAILATDGGGAATVPPELAEAARRLLEPPPAPPAMEPDEVAVEDPAGEQAPTGDAAPAEATAKGAARRELPTEALPCDECGTTDLTEENTPESNLEQTKFAVVRFRRPLCRPCMASQ